MSRTSLPPKKGGSTAGYGEVQDGVQEEGYQEEVQEDGYQDQEEGHEEIQVEGQEELQ